MEAKLKNDTELNLKYEPKKKNNVLLYLILIILSIVFLAPIFIVLYNSFRVNYILVDLHLLYQTQLVFQDLLTMLMV